MARTRLVIDTDPGVDDAVAILLALASPEIDVVALTTVAGNVSLEKTTLNARRLLELAGRHDVIVASSAASPSRSTCRWSRGTATGPQDAQWMIGMGQPQPR